MLNLGIAILHEGHMISPSSCLPYEDCMLMENKQPYPSRPSYLSLSYFLYFSGRRRQEGQVIASLQLLVFYTCFEFVLNWGAN